MKGVSSALLAVLLVASILAVEVSMYIADWLRHAIEVGRPIAPGQVYATWEVYLAVAFIWALTFRLFSVFDSRIRRTVALSRLIAANAVSALLLASVLYFIRHQDFSRVLYVYFSILSTLLLVLSFDAVWTIWRRLRRSGKWARRALIIGRGAAVSRVAASMSAGEWTDVCVVAALYLDQVSDPVAQLELMHATDVILVLPASERAVLSELVMGLADYPVRVYIVPDLLDLVTVRASVEDLNGMPLVGIRTPRINGFDRWAKRAFDVAVSAVALVLAAPVMLLVALAVRLDSTGPALFIQRRVGENGRPFNVIKFRSMSMHAEAMRGTLVDPVTLAGEPAYKLRRDPRVTRVGRVLRRTSLDELPQLINVLKGEMSLVGPRPEEADVVRLYNAWQRQRLAVKPGLTGPMQVGGRGELSIDERVRLELRYIEQYSFLEDLLILIKTVPAVVSGALSSGDGKLIAAFKRAGRLSSPLPFSGGVPPTSVGSRWQPDD